VEKKKKTNVLLYYLNMRWIFVINGWNNF